MDLYDESGIRVRRTTYTYGPEGEVLSVGGDTPEPASQTYDGLYRIKTLTDARGNTTTYTFDLDGRLRLVSLPGGDTIQYPDAPGKPAYDALNRVLRRIDGNGRETLYEYGSPWGLSKITYSSNHVQYPGSTAAPLNTVTVTYDPLGRVYVVVDGWTTRVYAYDVTDALTSVTTNLGSSPGRTISYTYNHDGSRASMNIPNGFVNGTFTYSYDNAGRMTGMSIPGGEQADFNYYDNDRPSGQVVRNWAGTQVYASVMDYNPIGQMTGLHYQHSPSGAWLAHFQNMTHDGAGNRQGVTVTSDFSLPGFTGAATYGYDSASDRLMNEASTRGGGSGYTNPFLYDAAGNVTRYSSIQSGNNWNGRTYNVKNQPQDGVSLFDGNGNQTRSPRFTTISHDWEDRPTQFDLNGGVFKRSGYHVEGTRAWSSGTSSADTWYLYDGATPVAELDFSGNLVAINAFGPNGLICRRTATGGARFYLFDERGNTAQRLDNNGNLLASHVTDAYGATVAPQNALPSTDVDPFDGMGGQLGYYQDETTGLLLCTFRFYDPTQARWLTRDPIGYSGGVNLYGYVTGNPIMGADPLGLFTIGGFEFDREVFSSGIRTGLAATGSAFTGGIWDGGAERCKPGFGVSYGLAVIGREALAMAGMRALQFKMLASPRSHPTFVFQRGPGGNPWTALKTGTIYIPEYVWKMGGAALRRAISHETVHANISLSLPRNLRFLRQGITGGSVQWRVLEEHLARRVAGASRWQALRDMGFSNLGIDALRYWAPGWMDIARGSLEWYNWTH